MKQVIRGHRGVLRQLPLGVLALLASACSSDATNGSENGSGGSAPFTTGGDTNYPQNTGGVGNVPPPAGGTVNVPGGGGVPVTPGNGGVPVTGGGGVPNPPPGAGGAPPVGAGGTPATPPGGATFCDALGVVRRNCHTCHAAQPAYGAPMPLATYADFTANGKITTDQKVSALIKTRIHDTQHPMPPADFGTLSAADIATLDGWVDQGAPAGSDTTCASLPPAPPPKDVTDVPFPTDCEKTYKLVAGNGGKATVTPNAETHPQFYINAPWPSEAQALAFRPITDNKKVLHHWILYAGSTFITGWAPGSQTKLMPKDVGMYLPGAGTQMRLDVHYNNLGNSTTEQDASGVEICVIETKAKFRPNTAAVFMQFAALPSIPPNQKVDNVGTCKVRTTTPVTLIGSSPHMHKLGRWAKLELTQNGQTRLLHNAAFDFEDQRAYALDPMPVIKTGDVVKTTCTFENNTPNYVTFGENTGNEMCFNFAAYYPRGALSCSP